METWWQQDERYGAKIVRKQAWLASFVVCFVTAVQATVRTSYVCAAALPIQYFCLYRTYN
jgi:hypothetical protein